jgi:maleylacetoacetate isomerase
MDSHLILYSYYRSSASYRVRIALNLKKLKYEYRAIHLLRGGGEQHSAEYRKLNPIGQVPCLIHEGKPLNQSMAILEYLDLISAEPRLFPQNPYDRAIVIQICEIVNSGIQPLQNTSVMAELEKKYGLTSDERIQWIQHFNRRGLVAIEEILKVTAGEHAFGNAITAAECFLVPHVFSAKRFDVDLTLYPTLVRVCNAVEQDDAFALAHPSKQPDAE